MSDFVSGIIGTAGGLALVTLALVWGASSTGQGATLRDRILSSPSLSPLLIIHYFLPYGLVIMALFMDLMSMLPQGSIGVAIGILLMLANRGIGGAPDFSSDLCEIPGLKGLSSKFVPQSLLFVSTVVTYLAAFVTSSTNKPITPQTASNIYQGTGSTMQSISAQSIGMTPSASARIGASWGLALSVILIQLIGIISTPECLTDPLVISGFPLPPYVRPILAVVIGMAVGGGSGAGMANNPISQPTYTVTQGSATPFVIPGTVTPPPTQSKGPGFVRERFQLGAGLGEIPTPSQGGDAPVDMAKSSGAVTPGESSDQFVCEAYKNGQLVSSTLTG